MMRHPLPLTLLAVALVGAGVLAGRWSVKPSGNHPSASATAPAAAASTERKVLYWYDPMAPATKFDKPGRSPFMDMELVPKYADEVEGGTVRIDPRVSQNLGLRLAPVTSAPAAAEWVLHGALGFDQRDVAVVQTRVAGFVEKVWPLAPGDVVHEGQPLAELLVPEWAAAQQEFLSLRTQPELAEAALNRLRLTGLPETQIRELQQTGQVRARLTLRAPRGGLIQELDVRAGMSLMAGATLAKIQGLGRVWLELTVPEAQAAQIQVGQSVHAEFTARPGQPVKGTVTSLLPALDEASRSLRARVELPNPGGKLRPGFTAQAHVQSTAGAGEALPAVPTEAVIRTGQRSLVMVSEGEGRFRPVEVTLAGEVGPLTRIRSGLGVGQQVVASGQFLIDSEANLAGLQAAPARATASAAGPVLHASEGVIEALDGLEVTLAHGPFPTLKMGGMTMPFPLANAHVAHGLKVGDKVRIQVSQGNDGLTVQKLEKLEKPKATTTPGGHP
ncbi:efflux RND transporter periplasmic adaptor subunit [Inhella gelatinilytica]|uniref:Efflux RND transporter periplasmic adaptor subunit n=1 Tax=Inhella gelatinilytica TaxID=2795030 RepID=A0A931IZM5_9BURK|nr:efflux RND transporter periplasmic adaptor subunit [Inhella gelatinilytica]MBH9552721.1 efflux RND transporter periplasmic adaptor subunit [Inhella gelatinilytica]